MKILFLASNPQSTSRLNLEKEVREIEEGLRRSKFSDLFQLVQRWEVRPRDLRRALLEENPDIVHFSGHGKGQAGLVLVDQAGNPKPATGEALANLFGLFSNIKCVLLNACYAEVQAKAIVGHINYVIGMKDTILDDAAIAFTTGFYDGLGYGRTIEDAFELGKNAILWERSSFSATTRQMIPVDLVMGESAIELPEHLKPILLKKIVNIDPTIPIPQSQNDLPTTEDDAIQKYQERVREYLTDRTLTPVAKFQLATLAKQLGISEPEANNILKTELDQIDQAKVNYQNVLRETFEAGYYPFDSVIEQQLQGLQTSLKLSDEEIAEISRTVFQQQAEIQNQKGNNHYNQREYQKAIADYNQAIHLNPEYAIAYNNRGNCYQDLKEYQKAIADYNQAILINPEYAEVYKNRGYYYHNQGEYQKAIADYNQAILLNPEDPDFYNNRGYCYNSLKEYQKAIQDFQQAADLYQHQGKTEDYQDALNRISEINKSNRSFLRFLDFSD